MARLHNQISRGIFNDALKRILGIQKSGDGLERFSETLQPIVDPWSDPIWSFLRDERLSGDVVTVAAVAAEFGYAALVNPAASRMLARLLVAHTQDATAQFTLRVASEATFAASLGTSTTGNSLDRRYVRPNTTDETRCVILSGTDAAATLGNQVDKVQSNATINSPEFPNAKFVTLAPGHGVAIVCLTVNLLFTGVFCWLERTALPGEL